jgi:serine/threonine-protein kinase RsbW
MTEVRITDKKMNIASSSENVLLVETLINDICRDSSIPEDYYGNILVAVTEAFNNAVQHGNKLDPSKNVEFNVHVDQKNVQFTIKDQGPGFDFNNLPDPTNPENIEKPNGRGVFLMRQLADKVEFADNGAKVVLGFTIPAN